jgi:hypothetical protein
MGQARRPGCWGVGIGVHMVVVEESGCGGEWKAVGAPMMSVQAMEN